ncbi:MAG: HAD-IA family hydrolase [Gammaproteobacteria bacterium]|nr:HAD-IA family hydrolase [Gammaproteobacteria bacterium]
MTFSRAYKILTFDVIGTLIDFETGILNCIRAIADNVAIELTDREILESFAQAEDAQHRLIPNMSFTQMLEPIYCDMATTLELPIANDEAQRFRLSVVNWPAFPDSIDALRRLKTSYRLVALTNADNWALDHMATTLGQPFHDAVTASDVGCNKPDPQMFAYCRGRQSVHGFMLNDYLHVAQSQYHDIGVAKRLGYHVCLIERRRRHGFGATPIPQTITTPHYHYSTLAELATNLLGSA